MNRSLGVKLNDDKTLTICMDNDQTMQFIINPVGVLEHYHYYNKQPEKSVTEIILDDLNYFYKFTDRERKEYTETLKLILED